MGLWIPDSARNRAKQEEAQARRDARERAQTAEVCICRDCGWRGHDPVITRDVVYGWEEPWDELTCPECGENVCEEQPTPEGGNDSPDPSGPTNPETVHPPTGEAE